MAKREGRGTWHMLKRRLLQACIVSMTVLAAAHPAYAEHGGPPVCVSCTLEWEPATFGPMTASGTVSIDDDDPAGTGLTISARTGGDTLSTVAAFEQGLNALDGFVNGIESNASCPPGEICFGTSNEDIVDEFWPVLSGLDDFMGDIESFRADLVAFDQAMAAADLPPPESSSGRLRGTNPIVYTWSDTSGTDREVKVQVSNFKLADTRREKRGNFLIGKTCVVMRDHEDLDGSNTWVSITRRDPPANLGLWQWNPFGGRITKTSRAYYTVDKVGIAGTTRPQ